MTASTVTTHQAHRTPLDWIAVILLVVGGLNWGLVGLFQFDLVAAIFGTASVVSRIVYVLVGISAVYFLIRAVVTPKH